MAHIVEFKIIGLAGRDSVFELVLNRDVNVFFGINGSGKTSLLKILYSAMSKNTKILENVPFENAEVKLHSLLYDKDIVFTINKNPYEKGEKGTLSSKANMNDVRLSRNKEKANKLKWVVQGSEGFESQTWQHRYLPTNRLLLNPNSEEYLEFYNSSEEIDSHFADSIRNLWLSYSAEVLGDVRKVQEQGLTSILCDVLAQSNKEENLINTDLSVAYNKAHQFLSRQNADTHLGTFEEFILRFNKDKNIRKIINDIVKIENAIEQAVQPQERLKQLIQKLYTGNKSVEFTDKEISVKAMNKSEIGLNSLSSGEKQLLLIFIEALIADKSSLIIDEPELSMHIDWQKELINDLTLLNSETQLIIATHSPEIMATLPDEKIFRL